MAEMVCSALAQEAVSRSVSFVLGKREEKSSQGHLMERLQMAISEMEFALERDLPIRHLSLIGRRKEIKSAYVEAMELLDKQKQKVVPAGQEVQDAQGVKRKRWVICANNLSLEPFVSLSTDVVRRFEWYADRAGKYVRDVESGSSLHHYTFCNPIVRHLLEGKTLAYSHFEKGNPKRGFLIWPTYSEERGVEAVLVLYNNNNYVGRTTTEKTFHLVLILRLSESTDIVGAAIKGLQLFTSEFKLVADCAMGELSQLSNSHDAAQFYMEATQSAIWESHMEATQLCRPDPACCKGSRHGLCANNNVSSEFADIFPEQVIYMLFQCYYIPALEPSTRSTFHDVGRSNDPPLLPMLRALFAPHYVTGAPGSCAVEVIGDVEECRNASLQQVAETLKSDAAKCFLRQPDLTEYNVGSFSKHGCAWFEVEKASTERARAPKTWGRYNTRGSKRRK